MNSKMLVGLVLSVLFIGLLQLPHSIGLGLVFGFLAVNLAETNLILKEMTK